nr:hypothetical protein [Burkholderia sp. Ac-20344]
MKNRKEGDYPAAPRRGFYQAVKKRSYIRPRGKLAQVDAFRVGCIAHVGEAGIPGAGAAITDTLKAIACAACPRAWWPDSTNRAARRRAAPLTCIAVRRYRFRVRTGFRFCAVCGTATSLPH